MTTDLYRQPAGPAAIRALDLHKRYGDQVALDGLDLTVAEGAVYVLVGPNGAGKTTTLRTLLDLARADRGTVTVFGRDSIADGAAVRASIGWVPDRHDLGFPDFTVGQLLHHHAAYFPGWDDAYAGRLVRDLETPLAARCGVLSKGQARRVQLVMALAHRPPLLLLDEPTDGLDPLVRDRVVGMLADHLAASPTTVLLSTHRVHEVEGLGDHLGVLRGGRLLAQIERDELSRRLVRVRGEVAEGWSESAAALPFPVVVRSGHGRERTWTLWTDGEPVEAALGAAGITPRSVDALGLEEATRALLAMDVAEPAADAATDRSTRAAMEAQR